MMGLCYFWSLVTLCLFFYIAVLIMNFQVVVLITLVGTVGSAPVSRTPDKMDKETINQALSLISKILKDIPTTHSTWINSKSLILGDNTTRLQLQYLKKSMIPSAPVLQNISCDFNLETCLAHIAKGLQLHLSLLKEIRKSTMLTQSDQENDLQVEIRDLLLLIKELQVQAGFDQSKQPSDEESEILDLNKHLTSDYKTQVATHLTLEQLQDFSCDVLHALHSMTSNSESHNTERLCGNAASA